jgi:hypothetical protein
VTVNVVAIAWSAEKASGLRELTLASRKPSPGQKLAAECLDSIHLASIASASVRGGVERHGIDPTTATGRQRTRLYLIEVRNRALGEFKAYDREVSVDFSRPGTLWHIGSGSDKRSAKRPKRPGHQMLRRRSRCDPYA